MRLKMISIFAARKRQRNENFVQCDRSSQTKSLSCLQRCSPEIFESAEKRRQIRVPFGHLLGTSWGPKATKGVKPDTS
jgi:hypothetical protein